jgi:hypothetical protein
VVLSAEQKSLYESVSKSIARDPKTLKGYEREAYFCDRVLQNIVLGTSVAASLDAPSLPHGRQLVPKSGRAAFMAKVAQISDNTTKTMADAKAMMNTLHNISCAMAWMRVKTEHYSRAHTVKLPVNDHASVHASELALGLATFLGFGELPLGDEEEWHNQPASTLKVAPAPMDIDPALGKRALALLDEAEASFKVMEIWNEKELREDILIVRGALLVKLGRKEEAIALWQDFLEKNPKAKSYKTFEHEIEKLLGADAESAAVQKSIKACADVDNEKLFSEVDRLWDAEGAKGVLRLVAAVDGKCAKLAPPLKDTVAALAVMHGDCATMKATGVTAYAVACE